MASRYQVYAGSWGRGSMPVDVRNADAAAAGIGAYHHYAGMPLLLPDEFDRLHEMLDSVRIVGGSSAPRADQMARELEQAKEALEHARNRVGELEKRDAEVRAILDATPYESTPMSARRVASAVPDCGPTDRDRREAQAARERLQRTILTDGKTDTGGRSLYESAADEIVRLRNMLRPADVSHREATARLAAVLPDAGQRWLADVAVEEIERLRAELAERIAALPLSPGGDVVTVEQQLEIDAAAKASAAEEAADQRCAATVRALMAMGIRGASAEEAVRIAEEEGGAAPETAHGAVLRLAKSGGVQIIMGDAPRPDMLRDYIRAMLAGTAAAHGGLSAEDAETLRGAGWWRDGSGVWSGEGFVYDQSEPHTLGRLRHHAARIRAEREPAAAHGAPGRVSGERSTAAGENSVAPSQGAPQGLPKPPRVEVGQRWRHSHDPGLWTVGDVDRHNDDMLATLRTDDGRVTRVCESWLTKGPYWIFLGPAPAPQGPKRDGEAEASGDPVANAIHAARVRDVQERGSADDLSEPTARDAEMKAAGRRVWSVRIGDVDAPASNVADGQPPQPPRFNVEVHEVWDVERSVHLVYRKDADPRAVLATVAELLGLQPPEYEIARSVAQAHERGAEEGIADVERRAKAKAAELVTKWWRKRGAAEGMKMACADNPAGAREWSERILTIDMCEMDVRKAFDLGAPDRQPPTGGEPGPEDGGGFPADVPPEVEEQIAEIATKAGERVADVLTQRRDRITAYLGGVIRAGISENLLPHEIAYRVVRWLEHACDFDPSARPTSATADERWQPGAVWEHQGLRRPQYRYEVVRRDPDGRIRLRSEDEPDALPINPARMTEANGWRYIGRPANEANTCDWCEAAPCECVPRDDESAEDQPEPAREARPEEEHGCGGPREACAQPGCEECGATPPTTAREAARHALAAVLSHHDIPDDRQDAAIQDLVTLFRTWGLAPALPPASSAIERAHADGVVEGLCRADGIIRSFGRRGEMSPEHIAALDVCIGTAIAEAGRAVPADRQNPVDRAALLALTERWERASNRLRGLAANPNRDMAARCADDGEARGFMAATRDLRRLLDAPRGPDGGEREPTTGAEKATAAHEDDRRAPPTHGGRAPENVTHGAPAVNALTAPAGEIDDALEADISGELMAHGAPAGQAWHVAGAVRRRHTERLELAARSNVPGSKRADGTSTDAGQDGSSASQDVERSASPPLGALTGIIGAWENRGNAFAAEESAFGRGRGQGLLDAAANLKRLLDGPPPFEPAQSTPEPEAQDGSRVDQSTPDKDALNAFAASAVSAAKERGIISNDQLHEIVNIHHRRLWPERYGVDRGPFCSPADPAKAETIPPSAPPGVQPAQSPAERRPEMRNGELTCPCGDALAQSDWPWPPGGRCLYCCTCLSRYEIGTLRELNGPNDPPRSPTPHEVGVAPSPLARAVESLERAGWPDTADRLSRAEITAADALSHVRDWAARGCGDASDLKAIAALEVLCAAPAEEPPAAKAGPRIELRDGAEVTVDSYGCNACDARGPEHNDPCTVHVEGWHVSEGARIGDGQGSWRVLERWPIASPAPTCGAVDEVLGPGLGPVCTRPQGHDGNHEAVDPATDRAVSAWADLPTQKPERVEPGQVWRCVGVDGELKVSEVRLALAPFAADIGLRPFGATGPATVRARDRDMLGLPEWSYVRRPA